MILDVMIETSLLLTQRSHYLIGHISDTSNAVGKLPFQLLPAVTQCSVHLLQVVCFAVIRRLQILEFMF